MREIDWLTLETLATEQCYDPAFSTLGQRFVPGEGGNPEAFIVGEAPGAVEEAQGKPFVGPCAVVRELMGLAGLHTVASPAVYAPSGRMWRQQLDPNCWLTNVVKFRPPRNRNPTDAEIKAARPYLRREWLAVGSPKLIIPIGNIALRAITGKRISILRSAGKCHYYTSRLGPEMYIWPMVHPSFVMRQGSDQLKELIEADWERLGAWRNNNG